MAYADQQMSGNKITALIVVALLHVVVGYALISGLAYSAFKKIKEVTTAVKIDPDKPPPPPPPPPPKSEIPPPPPIVAPPPAMNVPNLSPPMETVRESPPLPPTPTAQPAPIHTEAPPAKPCAAKPAAPKGRPGEWASDNDYPTRALQLSQEGVTGFRLSVGSDGKVSACDITRSSGSPELDKTTCDLMRRRARFTPAADCDGNPATGAYPSSVRWQIPKD